MNKRILDENLSIQEMIERYKEVEWEVRRNFRLVDELQDLDFNGNMVEYLQAKEFFTNVGNALEFVTASTNRVGDEIESLIGSDMFCSNLTLLSNNLDEKFVSYILAEGYNSEISISSRDFRQDIVLQTIESMLENKTMNEAIQNAICSDITVGDLKSSVNTISEMMNEFEVDANLPASVREQTIDAYFRAKETNELIKIDIVESKPINLEITESNDGYVMATNASMEAIKNNPDLEYQYNAVVRNNNEVVHNEAPKETTVDLSKVGSLIKYELFDDIGSIEKEQGIKTYEEKEYAEHEEKSEKEGRAIKNTSKSKSSREYER